MGKIVRFIFLFSILFSSVWAVDDMSGREFEPTVSDKLIFLGPGALRLGIYLGLADRLAGIEAIEKREPAIGPYREWLQKNKNLESLPVVSQGGPGVMPSLEALIKSRAKLIIVSFMEPSLARLIEEKTKIPVFMIHYGSGYGGKMEKLKAIKSSLLALGEVTKTKKRAEELLNGLKKIEENLKNIELKKKKVYIGGMGYKGAHGIGSTESMYVPFTLLGLENGVVSKTFGHQQVSIETIFRYNPDILFLDKHGKKIIEKEKRDNASLFKAFKAYKNKNVYYLDAYNFYNTNVENIYLNAWTIAKHLGAKVDIQKQKEMIMHLFYGQNYGK